MKRAILILLIASLAGCASVQTRRTDFLKTHTELAPEYRDAILKGKVIPGMSRDMVIAAWGQPVDEITEIISGQGVKSWLFRVYSGNYINIYAVKFDDGIVSEVRLINVQKKTYVYPDYYSPIHTHLFFLYNPQNDNNHH
jgi:hypothetical protein